MKKFLKNNRFLLISLAIVIVMAVVSFIDYWNDYGYGARYEAVEKIIVECEKIDWRNDPSLVEICNSAYNDGVVLDDALTMYFGIVFTGPLYYLGFIVPLLIMFCSIFKFHQKLKTGFLKNELVREKYSTYIWRELKKCYIMILPFLIILVLLFLLCCILSGNLELSFIGGIVDESFGNMFPLSYIVYLLVLTINYLLYVNLVLIYAKKNKNLFVCVIGAYLSWLAIDVFTEVIIGRHLLKRKLNLAIGDSFNIVSVQSVSPFNHSLIKLGLALILIAITGLIVYLTYRKKESVLIECEK